jgi:ferredoxin-thioredoxin reductase catalytic subunit
MTEEFVVNPQDIDRLYQRLRQEAEAGGYHLNPDESFTKELLKGLRVNEKRYGYWACPCRLASGDKNEDLDIICPCDYRDPDLDDYGACYCALYVTGAVLKGERKLTVVPERRLPAEEREKAPSTPQPSNLSSLPYPVWRCKVCGYLCAREGPPEVCPVCKAKKDRFERFL